MLIKRLTRVYLGVFVVIACSIGLVCFFAAKSNREAGALAANGGGAHNHDRSRRVVPHGSGTSSAAISDGERLEDSNHIDKPGSTNSSPELFGAATNLNENAEAEDITDDEEASPEEIAALKEKLIREKFGVILRQGKWIPTIGGGTNLVYITTGSLPPGRVGEVYNVQFQATSGFSPYLWSVVGGELPGSFSFDSQSGKLSGIPIEPTTMNFFLQVTDRRGAKDVAEYVLTFQPEQSLGIATESLPAAVPGEDYFFQLQATGWVPPYAWSAAGNLDEIGTLVLDPQTGV
ncbi:MAG: Ig domain-containing protein, partial [Thermovirgaceae bacterium]|nr:Ig domain-containing protein [Thermovirgaceae bacterium]